MAPPPSLGAAALLVKSMSAARSVLVGSRQNVSDVHMYTILLAVSSLSHFLQCSSFKSCFLVFQQGNSPRMLEKHRPFFALCGCSGSSSYYGCGEIQGEMVMSHRGVAPQWGGTGVPPTSTSAIEHVCLQYKLVKKYFNTIYCTELGFHTVYYNAKIFV